MSDRIKVHVVKYRECKNLILRYKDPLTGKHVRKSSGTANTTDARKAAARWEDDLNSGKARGRFATTWEQFRLRYEQEVLPGFAPATAEKAGVVFNRLESVLPQVRNGLLRELTAERLSVWQAEMRKRGRAEATIGSYLSHLRAALAWAVDQGILAELPKIKRPKRAKRSGGADPMKGRPISGEEFDRLLAKVQAVVGEAAAESWRYLLRGLWWSGLRLGEALDLYWDRQDKLCVDLSGRRPMLRILAELEKGGRDRLLAMAPEFADFLLQTPAAERHGRVFKPQGKAGGVIASPDLIGHAISRIGKLAGVKVHTQTKADPDTGKAVEVVKYASAHDLRRSFGERWAVRVMPQVLMVLMRHSSIQTTMRFYVGRNANTAADALWAAYAKCQEGTVLGTVTETGEPSGVAAADVSGYAVKGLGLVS
jgi:integrase